jgi:CRISPR/Cas system-associated exonuclease Cas4 (RecB family)
MSASPVYPLAPGSPEPAPPQRPLPDYLPARMVNEFVYCPRLFFYEWVEGVFQSSADTEQGAFEHRRVDKPSGALPDPAPAEEGGEPIHTRSLLLSSKT